MCVFPKLRGGLFLNFFLFLWILDLISYYYFTRKNTPFGSPTLVTD